MTESGELFLYNKEQMNQIRGKFTPQFNLYQKVMLQEKIDCFERFYKVPSSYYECIEKTDDKMNKNSTSLQKKFQSLDHFKFECEEKCRLANANPSQQKELTECMKGCTDTMKISVIDVYKRFYENQVGSHAEYKNIKI